MIFYINFYDLFSRYVLVSSSTRHIKYFIIQFCNLTQQISQANRKKNLTSSKKYRRYKVTNVFLFTITINLNPATPYAEPVQRLCQLQNEDSICLLYFTVEQILKQKQKETNISLGFSKYHLFPTTEGIFSYSSSCMKVKKKFLSTLN